MSRKLIGFLLLFCNAHSLLAGDWPQFRGPGGNGISNETGLPLRWDRKRNVRWRAAIPGKGWSSPVIVGGRVFLTTAVSDGGDPKANRGAQSLRALCLDARSGDTLWSVELFKQGEKRIHGKNSHASPTPVVDGEAVYVHFGTNGTARLDRDGKVVWRNSSINYNPVHGSGGSPALVNGKLVFSCDGSSSPEVHALDAGTGKTAWRTPRPESRGKQFAFCTPLPIRVDNALQIVLPGAQHVCAYEPDSGKELWRVAYPGGYSIVPRPVHGDGLVFVSTGYDRPRLLAIRDDGRGDITRSHIAWSADKSISHNPSFVHADGRLYVVSDNGIATCFDAATGRRHWRQRLGGNYSGSPILAEGRLYFVNEDGLGVIIDAKPKFHLVAKNPLGERTQASPATADGALFLRTIEAVYRIEKPRSDG